MKKVLSVFLAVLMLLTSCVCVASAVKDFGVERTTLPTVYIAGQGQKLFIESSSDAIYPLEIPDGYIGDYGKKLIAPLMKGLAVNDWKEYEDILCEAFGNITKPIALDGNGNVTDGSHTYSLGYPSKKHSDGTYSVKRLDSVGKIVVHTYGFNQDWRLDPCEHAVNLDKYIDNVLAVTGEKKVNIIGRCLGANIALAYMSMFGTDKLDRVILNGYGFDGFSTMDALWTGEMDIDADSLSRLLDDYLRTEDMQGDPVYDFLSDFAYILTSLKSLNLPVSTINKIYKSIYKEVMPRNMMNSFGTFPSFWGLLSDDAFEKAKTFLLSGKEEEYAGLIEKIDNFHYNIFDKSEEIIQKAIDNGTDVRIISKYGLQVIPIVKNNNEMSDQLVQTTSSSCGATCAKVNGILSDSYINGAKANGTDKYISPDKQIDASTCTFRDYTWFVKDVDHRDTPEALDDFMAMLLNQGKGFTVFDDENMPQFVEYNRNAKTIVPVEEIKKTDSGFVSFFKRLFSSIKNFFNMIINLFK